MIFDESRHVQQSTMIAMNDHLAKKNALIRIASYRGQTRYIVGDRRYVVRDSMIDDGTYNGEHYTQLVRDMVGTVINEDDHHNFPPIEVVIQFPGMTGARYSADYKRIEYMGAKPETHRDWTNHIFATEARRLDLERWCEFSQ